MNCNRWAIALIATCAVSCETAHEIGRTITAPVRYVLNEPEPAPATNTSDVTNPGQPVAVPSPTPTPRADSRKFRDRADFIASVNRAELGCLSDANNARLVRVHFRLTRNQRLRLVDVDLARVTANQKQL